MTGERAPRPAATNERLRAKPEALLEQAVAAFQVQAGRVEAGAARAFATAATLIEKTENERSDKLSRLHDRLTDLEARMQKPDNRRPAAPVHDPLSGADCDDQFSSLEHRLKTLMQRLERPNPRVAASEPARRLEEAISAIEARRGALDAEPGPEPCPKPVRPPLASLIKDGFEALSQKLDRAQRDQAPQNPEDDKRFDRLQQGIEGLAGRLESLRRDSPAAAFDELADRVESALAESSASSAGPAELEKLRGELAAMSRALADVAPRGAVAGVESAVRELANRVELARDALLRAAEAQGETASSAEIEALARQVAAMSQALENVAPRSQLAALESSLRALGENLERSRSDGLREAVLAPIESLARDLRGELAQTLAEVLPHVLPAPGASADFDVVATQLRQIEGKLEDLLRAGWADRENFHKIQDKSDELRATIADAVEHFAPIARIEQQIAALSDRLEEVSHRAGEASRAQEAGLAAGLAQSAAHWRGVETRLDDLAAQLGDGQGEAQGMRTPPTLEPLLRALAEKLDLATAPSPEFRVLEALERQMAQVTEKLSEKLVESRDARDPPWGARLEKAIEDLASRFELSRQYEHEAAREALREALAGLPEIASLRDERKASDVRAQQTLGAVHETLEKVVDRLAMLEEDVIEARAGQGERAPRKLGPPASSPFDHESFLVEPGGGRPDAARAADADGFVLAEASRPSHQASPQANYIDVARRAIAARTAGEQADKSEAEQRERAKADEADAFPRPMAARSVAGRRLPALLAIASAVLVLGAWQTYRFFEPAPPVASVTSAIEPGAASPDEKPVAKTLSHTATASQQPTTNGAQAPTVSVPASATTPALSQSRPGPGASLETGSGAGLGAGQTI